MNHNFRLSIDELRIAPMNKEDAQMYRKLRNLDKELFFSSNIITVEQQDKWYEWYLTRNDEFMFSVYCEGKFIGGFGLYNYVNAESTIEFGRIVIDKRYRGQGLGRRTVEAAIEICKSDLNIKRIYLEVMNSNNIAKEIYKKVGFKEGTCKEGIINMSLELER